jgi:hypothetical protein
MDEITPSWIEKPLSFEDNPDLWVEEDDFEDEDFDLEEDEELE